MTTATKSLIGASTTWNQINWKEVENQVFRLQVRIAKAIREKRYGKAKSLQWLLTHSRSAKMLAVKKVTKNKGSKTAGVDGVTWKTNDQKVEAVSLLQRKGYQPQPLRRLYIPKKNGKRRPLSIPTMIDRAMQALYLFALEPISETIADPNSYGFRKYRATIDAIGQCFNIFSQKGTAQWVLEGDIKSCFDTIDHQWLINNVPTDRLILNKWLTAGYIEQNILHNTKEGTPQGGIISPTLLVITLAGLEKLISQWGTKQDKLHTVIYADDFIVSASNKQVLENEVLPALKSFLATRGLALSKEKTVISHISKGFNFLGFNVRKYKNGKLIIKPAKERIKSFLANIRETISKNRTVKTELLIQSLNPKIRGWANYYKNVVSKQTFSYVDDQIFKAIVRWIRRRHPKKSAKWMTRKYFKTRNMSKWSFFSKVRDICGKISTIDLAKAAHTTIKRHPKIRSNANPFDLAYLRYLEMRKRSRKIPTFDYWNSWVRILGL